jgi:hypothetical protein
VDVHPGREGAAATGEHRDADGRIGRELPEAVAQRPDQAGLEEIQRGTVEGAAGDAARALDC